LKHYSLRTEQTYVDWIKRFIIFHGKQHPENMGADAVRAFLSDLASTRKVAAATQNQAIRSDATPTEPSGAGRRSCQDNGVPKEFENEDAEAELLHPAAEPSVSIDSVTGNPYIIAG
jgi:hypothetical protein